MKLNGSWQRALIGVLVVVMALPAPVFAQNNIPVFRQEELDQMLAPIALYPDSLLAQILMAATYPLEVVQADRWVRANKNLSPEARNDALDRQNWDPSVKALVAFPDVLAMMSEKLEWTQKVGDAFLAQEADVMATIQDLRAKAYAAGNLRSTPQQTVRREDTIIVIEPANPQVVYVPVYSPMVVYGPWWYPAYPPYVIYAHPPAAAIATGVIVFGTAVAVAVAWNHWWGYWDWRHRHVYVNVNRTVNIHKTTVIHTRQIQTTVWRHEPVHRKGVAYRDPRTREKFAPASRQAVEMRRDYRGYDGRGQARPVPVSAGPAPDNRHSPAVAKPAPEKQPAPAVTQPPAHTRQAPAVTPQAPEKKAQPAVQQPHTQARQAPAVAQPPAQTRQAPAVSRPAAPGTVYRVDQGGKVRMESTRGRESLSSPKGKQHEAPKDAPASRSGPAEKSAPAGKGGGQKHEGGHGRR
ncbi:MAG: DUF3300 domain-containing protein [Syntrophaceae bacterium]|nr:DUF3300 domain-containing protein [Syntrophaceae bacterium]